METVLFSEFHRDGDIRWSCYGSLVHVECCRELVRGNVAVTSGGDSPGPAAGNSVTVLKLELFQVCGEREFLGEQERGRVELGR